MMWRSWFTKLALTIAGTTPNLCPTATTSISNVCPGNTSICVTVFFLFGMEFVHMQTLDGFDEISVMVSNSKYLKGFECPFVLQVSIHPPKIAFPANPALLFVNLIEVL